MTPQMGIKTQLASQVVSDDGTSIVQTFTQTLTQAQLTMQLANSQNQLATLTNQIANVNANIANLQAQLALFPQTAQATSAQQ
jgi:hypothetical protein